MTVHLSAKPAGAIHLYSWKPDLADGDSIASFSLSPATVSILSSEQQDDEIAFYVSGGLAGNVYAITADVETSNGESLRETLYIPIMGPGVSFSDTAQDVITFALRPVTGMFRAPRTAELADGLEWLNGMVASWRTQGADLGLALPLTLATPIYVADEHVLAVKNNLRVLLAEQYGRQVAPTTAVMAVRGLQQIKNANLPDRDTVDYF